MSLFEKEAFENVFHVKSFATISNSQVELEMIHSIRHDHIVNVLKIFRFEGSFYVVLERMVISLV